MRSALLRGREHLEIGAIDAVAEGPVAIAISVGGAKKAYAHTDPNEDAAFFSVGDAGTLVAVADAHGGFEASEVVLEHLAAHPGPQWVETGGVTPESWSRHALAAVCDANGEILRERLDSDIGKSRTTLTMALVVPEADALLYACFGDSHLFRVHPGGAVDLAAGKTALGLESFLGHGQETPQSLAEKCRVGVEPLGHTIAVVLASDGLSEHWIGVKNPGAVVFESIETARRVAPELRPLKASRSILEAALAAHRHNASGDNVCAAVVWLEDWPAFLTRPGEVRSPAGRSRRRR